MPITNAASLNEALKTPQYAFFNKNSATMASGVNYAMWRVNGTPATPGIPTSAEICDETTPGGLTYTQPKAGKILYLVEAEVYNAAIYSGLKLVDRLGHMGGLSGTNTGVQTVDLDISGSASNLAARRGDYSEVMWSLQWSTATGSTATTITINLTNIDDTAESSTWTTPGTIPQHRSQLIPRGPSGKPIKKVNSIQLSPSTGTAGNFGVAAFRLLAPMAMVNIAVSRRLTALQLGLPVIHNRSCLAFEFDANTTSSSITGVRLKLIEG